MNKTQPKKFVWCPVCMMHTYQQNENGRRECQNKDHQAFLHFRSDPWIEEYRKKELARQVPVGTEV